RRFALMTRRAKRGARCVQADRPDQLASLKWRSNLVRKRKYNVNRECRRSVNFDLPRFVHPNRNGYRALLRFGHDIVYLGTYRTPEEASQVAEREARRRARQHGEAHDH